MKILVATGIFPPDIGGPATYSKLIADEFTKQGHKVIVLTYGIPPLQSFKVKLKKPPPKFGFEVVYVSRKIPKPFRHLVYFFKVFRHSPRADIVYLQDPASAGLPAALACRLLGRKFVAKIVGDYAWEQGIQRFGVKELLDDFLKKGYGLRIGILRKIQTYVARSAYRIIVPSQYLKDVVTAWGVTSAKVRVVYNAVFFDETYVSRDVARSDFGFSEADIILMSAGRLVPWKGFSLLVEVVAELSAKYPTLQLYIAGAGPEMPQLREKVTKLKMGGRIVFLGGLERNALLVRLKASDIFVLNTGYEGFSHQLLEALVLGLPVITTPVGGNKELLRESESILIAGYNNKTEWISALETLIQNKQSYIEKRVDEFESLAKRFGKEKMLRYTLEVLTPGK